MRVAQLRKFAAQLQDGLNNVNASNEAKLPDGIVPMRSILYPSKKGTARLEHYEVTREAAAFHNLRQAINNHREGGIVPGKYVRLVIDKDTLMMSDAPFEARSNRDIIEAARGTVFIAGLGMGMILVPILQNPKVTTVVVAELNKDVIDLVLPQLMERAPLTANQKMKLVVVHQDVFDSKPKDNYFDVIYFDIWPTICTDNIKEFTKLKKLFKKSLKPGGWMKCWVEGEVRERKTYEDSLVKRARAFRARQKAKREKKT